MLIEVINYVISVLFCVCYAYQFIYLIVPFILKRRGKRNDGKSMPPELRRYDILISARNEESVIGDLIESIKNQTYPQDMIHIFVCADNCTDSTAQVAENQGADVFVRHNLQKIGKGYAQNFLIKEISKNFAKERFDGYLVFDADNILEPNYIFEMNKTFSEGTRIVTGYRNSKNYADNWISAGYSLWFLRESQYLNRPRYLLGTSCAVSGTGFGFLHEVLEKIGCWNYYLLTEDIEFTIDCVISGEKIAYCESAVLYDEQPTDFKQSVLQRLRWAKGYFQVFSSYGERLLRGIFSRNFLSCYDMSMAIMPAMVLSLSSIAANLLMLFLNPGSSELLVQTAISFGQSSLNIYLTFLFIGVLTLISEWKKIHAPASKKLKYLPLFPVFMFTYIPISIAAMFVNVEWKQIRHKSCKTLEKIMSDK